MRGPTRSFPFSQRRRLFLISSHRRTGIGLSAGLDPSKYLTVDAEFRNVGMTAQLRKGEVSGLQIASAVGRFVDFKHAELLLEADTHGDLDHALPYLQRSPIGPARSQFWVRGSGELHAQLQLSLP